MRNLWGSFTVEASILVPFLLSVCVVFVYLGIYAYDKTLMTQDANAIVSGIRDENACNGKDVKSLCEAAFSEIKREHPYLSVENLRMDVSEKGNNVSIVLSADWKFPLYRGYSRTISKERVIKRINPVKKMYLTEVVKKAVQGETDDDTDDLRD
ncbi:MAG: pilus assembly protein [Lachnospiraceae bacterium]|nr:pilus assembly protein [Lachnospiraceae bacterium]